MEARVAHTQIHRRPRLPSNQLALALSGGTVLVVQTNFRAFAAVFATLANWACSTPAAQPDAASPQVDATAAHDAQVDGPDSAGPAGGRYYFYAFHNEPHLTESEVAVAFPKLRSRVEKASGYGIKLTLMMGISWADYFVKHPNDANEVRQWASKGHELSSHHHSAYHPKPDGFASSQAFYETTASPSAKKSKAFQGTYAEWTRRQQLFNPTLKSGCAGDEADKSVMPSIIAYDSCSGFLMHGPVGVRGAARDSAQGFAEYVLSGTTLDGINRRWLAHTFLDTSAELDSAKSTFLTIANGVYGAVNHSDDDAELAIADQWIEFLHQQDPSGAKSVTLTGAIEGQLLPVQAIDSAVLNQVFSAKQ